MSDNLVIQEEKKERHVDVIICVPGYSFMSQTVTSLLQLTQALNENGYSWAFSTAYSSHVANARELTINASKVNNIFEQRPFQGEITYKKLLWIDSDIAFTPEQALQLLKHDKDIVTGGYLMAGGEVAAYPEALGNPYTINELNTLTELTKIWGAGMGFMAVNRGVFEALSRPWFQGVEMEKIWEDGKSHKFMLMGEDLAFCERAQRAGFEVWLDPDIRVIHHKTYQLTWEGAVPLL